MNKMIQIENISKVFRTTEVETVALNHVNLEVKEGLLPLWDLRAVASPPY